MTPLAAVLLLSLVHLGAGLLDFLRTRPRSRLLSFAGGVSIAFVFVHLVPAIASSQRIVTAASPEAFAFFERNVWLLALAGVVLFHGLERMVLRARRPSRALADGTAAAGGIYWLHISAFALYNALVGYLLVGYLLADPIGERSRDPILFALALALHFLVNDSGLREHHKRHFKGFGQWLLVLAPLLGWVIARGTTISPAGLSVLFAFLAGGILLNTFKEELPEERDARFWPLVLGAIIFAMLAVIW